MTKARFKKWIYILVKYKNVLRFKVYEKHKLDCLNFKSKSSIGWPTFRPLETQVTQEESI